MKIIILDDDAVFAGELYDQISTGCARRDWPLSCRIFSSPQMVLNEDLSDVQVAFLDIDMPEINGIEVACQLRQRYPGIILVFVTAYIQYAPTGYKVNAFRYIMKNQYVKEIDACLDAIQDKLFEDTETLLVELKDSTTEIALKDILYFEGTSYRRILLHRVSSPGPHLECLGKLGDYEKKLQDKGFVRLHKSFLVNMCYISRLANYQVKLRNGEVLKVSESGYRDICSQYLMWKGSRL